MTPIGHITLDVLGLVPVIGNAADGINAAWYAAEGEWLDAALSSMALIPGIGQAVTLAKSSVKAALRHVPFGSLDEALAGVREVLENWGILGRNADGGIEAADAGRRGAEVPTSAANAGRLNSQLAAEEIAGGHAFGKHVLERGEFPGVRTREEFAAVVENVIENFDEVRHLRNGRTAFWKDGVVVIRNPSAVDGGTAFVPVNGIEYLDTIR